jgi:predicted small secreted protein
MDTKKFKLICLSSLLILSLGACQNTISGFGKDVEKTGKSISSATK